MSELTYADIEEALKKVPIGKLPTVLKFIRSLPEEKTEPESNPPGKNDEYDIRKTKLWELCGIIKIPDENSDLEEGHIEHTTNYADTVDEVVYGISFHGKCKDDTEDTH